MNKKNNVLTYEDYVQGIDQLEPEQQLHLVELLSVNLKKRLKKESAKHKITELEGLGADIWEHVETDEYVRKERNSWD